ncbi:MAG: Rrf2 family transcriptional regulator [Planctomycetes bacterium]|nr:Rrf2 family transcriptional regulator [Planctomycetota bacterium]NUQ34949.1 Rrf2 family transcriptional regulator [Planctomycetaceae bacterium]
MISQTSEYAIRAIIDLAQQPPAAFVLTKELGERLGIPHHYLGKILQQLVRTGVLDSVRGRQGGFRLARAANSIKLREIIEPFENVDKKEECILGQDKCNDKVACPMHAFWKEVRDRYIRELESKTVADLAEFGQRRKAHGLGASGTQPKGYRAVQ